ncbi:MAG: hypothetical protein AMS22_06680 [Thiotrichales bacterium SG8_50]|nr:MAG: hypothetical protein AMS22_06680 [Thiotrichales bacterium SG8_50]
MNTVAFKLDEKGIQNQIQLLEHVSDAVIVTDLDFKILSWNKAAESMYGWPIEEVIGKPMGEVIPTDYLEEDREAVIAAFQAEGSWQGEVIQKGKNGSEIYVLASVTLIRDENDIPSSVLAINRDITRRKQAEDALGESEKNYHTVVEQVTKGILVMQDGQRKYYNPVWLGMTGYSAEEYDSLPFLSLVHADDLETVKSEYEKLLKDQVFDSFPDFRIITKSGDTKWLAIRGSTIDWDSRPAGMIFIEDITEYKRIEKELINHHDFLARLADSIWDAIFIVALPERKIVWASDSFGIIGYDPKECIGKTTEFLYPEKEEYLDFGNKLEASIGTGQDILHAEQLLRRKNGEIIPAEITATIYRKNKEVYQVTSVVRNMSKRKKVERALRDSEESFRAIIEQSPVSIQIHGLDGKLLRSNRAYAKLLSLNDETLKEVYEKYNVRIDAQAEALGIAPYIEKVYSGEEVVFPPYEYDGVDTLKTLDFENPVSRKCWIQTLGFPRKDKDGNVISAVFMSEDITDRKQAEEKILAYQQRLKALASKLTIAEERERRRIAAELHDHVSQSLALARIHLSTAQKATSESRRNELLDLVSQTLIEAIQDTRALTFELTSPLLKELGLAKAIAAWLRDQIGKPYNLETDFLDDGQEKPLKEDEQVILFRNVRELLANVVRHAQATEIRVSIEREVANIIITVQDDGIGFDPGSALQYEYSEDGFGLFSIQERMADFGGSLEIISAPGMGCTAVLTAPLDLG